MLDVELQIQEQVLGFSPTSIVLVFYTGNDLLDTLLGLQRYSVSANGTLQLDQDILREKIPADMLDDGWGARDALASFRLSAFLGQVVRGIRSDEWGHRDGVRAPEAETYTSNMFWSQRRYPAFAQEARRVSLAALTRIQELCDQYGVQLLVVSVPSIEQIYNPSWFGDSYDIRLPQRYIEEFAGSASVPYLDLLPSLAIEAREKGRNLHFQSDGHFNNLGHQVSGELVAEFIQRRAVD